MSKFVMMFLGGLLSALVLSSSASASVSKYCKLISTKDVGTPLGVGSVKVSSVSLAYPSETKSDKGRLTLCSFKTPSDMIAQTSVGKFTNTAGARNEFAAVVHREMKATRVAKTRGPWDDAYYMGTDGVIVLKGRFVFHLQYASETHGIQGVTQKVMVALAAKAARKL